MVLEPTAQEDIEDSLETRLRGRIAKLTNFVSSSFNKLFLTAFSEVLYEYEVRLLAAQLSGWVEYAGGPITQDDLDRLGLDDFDDVDLLNEFMLDVHLDNIGTLVGVERDPGEPATGEVRIDTFDDQTRVPDGMTVATPPNFDGEQLLYDVDLGGDNFVTPADQGNSNHVDVDVVATEIGTDHNIGAGRITQFRSPPPGVEGVNNPATIDGGEDEETNDELRERIKNAVFESSGGGTTAGIRGFIIANVEGVNDVFVDEFLNATPVFVDVIVDGGAEADVLDAIEESRPAGIRHNLVRPQTYAVAVQAEVTGSGVDTAQVKDEIEEYIFSLDLGDNYIEDRVIQRMLNIEPDIDNVVSLNTRIVSVTNTQIEYQSGTDQYDLAEDGLGFIEDEVHYYVSGKDIYELGVEPIESGSASVTAVVNGTEQSVADTEWDIVDDDGDGMLDSIDWTPGSTTPDLGTNFTVTYDTLTSTTETFTYDTNTSEYGLTYLPALAADSSITDNSGDTYTLGTDYDIIDADDDGVLDTVKWLGNSTPNDTETFDVTYEIDVGSINSVTGTLNGSDHTFTEGVDFNELDGDGDTYADQIDWSIGGDTPDDQTDFTVDASIQTRIDEDYFITNREKIVPVVDEVEVLSYD